MITYAIKGLDGVLDAFDGLTESETRRAKQNANLKAARVFRNAVRPRIPRTVGGKVRAYRSTKTTRKGRLVNFSGQQEDVHLRERIGFKRSRKTEAVIIGYVGLARAYGHIVEYGKRNGRPFVSRGNGAWRKTLVDQRENMLNAMGEHIGGEVVKIWGKRAKRYQQKITKLQRGN